MVVVVVVVGGDPKTVLLFDGKWTITIREYGGSREENKAWS